MSAAVANISFDTLTELTEGRFGRLDIPCPECTTWAGRSSNGRRRRVFRVWREHPDFASYHCARCGLSGFARRIGARTRFDPQRLAQLKAEAAERAGDYVAGQLRKARWLWRRAVPPRGTIVERYLRQRAIVGRVPSTIRYLPTSRPDRHPAMLVPYGMGTEYEPGEIEIAESAIFAVHLTFLKPDGSSKADVDPAKITIGSPTGAPLVLAPMNDLLGLAITEGIEDAISVHQEAGLGAWAAGSWSFMPALSHTVPDYANCVTIIADDDADGLRGARELACRLHHRGLHVELIEPSP
jgi:hypothetical protein